eukprot:TRINITY_DN29469_c0_g1_i1.p1 TRINITY_DN29469_c0_g1~~TRINITY_DN29469_c0_g1_i1.p1  ORF type:complete len:468 (-),score=70.09 TRINITY_DN29469_c0_g1_i1:28-1431(-)
MSFAKIAKDASMSQRSKRVSRIGSAGSLLLSGAMKGEKRPSGSTGSLADSQHTAHLNMEEQNERFKELDRVKRVEKEARNALHEQRFDEAFALANEALAVDPELHGCTRILAQVYLKRKEWDKVIAECTKLIALPSVHEKDYTDRGLAFLSKREYAAAIADCDKACDMYPPYVRGRYVRAQAKFYSDDFHGCVEDCSENIRLDCMDPYHWSLRAMAKVQLGALDDYYTGGAIDDCCEAIKLDYKHYIAWSTRGDARNDRGDHIGAVKDTGKALELFRKYADKTESNRPHARTHSNRADALVSLNRIDEAEFHCSRALAMDSLLADAWGRRSELKFARGDLWGAIKDAAHATELDGLDKDAYYCSSESKLILGDYHGAVMDAQSALRVDPNFDEAARIEKVGENYQRLLKAWRVPIVEQHINELHKDDTPYSSRRTSTSSLGMGWIGRRAASTGGLTRRMSETSGSCW